MNLNFKLYNQQFLETHKLVLDRDMAGNDALAKYGVRIVEAEVVAGALYWKVIGIHHLLPEENTGNHHIYLEILDEAGIRVTAPQVWAGRQFGAIQEPVKLDKPPAEPAGNIPMFHEQNTVWIRGFANDASDESDHVQGLHSDHPDELGPHGEIWNGRFHHSFYVVFQRTRKGENGIVTPPLDFIQYALDHALGNAVTPQFQFQNHQVRAFEHGLVFAPDDPPSSVSHLSW